MSEVQAYLFDRNVYDIDDVYNYIEKHNIEVLKKPHITDRYIRVRINEPSKYNHFITKDLNNSIKIIIGFI